MKYSKPKNRREFLFGGAQVAAGLAFLPSLFSFEAEAAAGGTPKRLITIFSKNGQRQEYWNPKIQANSSFAGGKELALSAFSATGLSPILGTAFSPYLSKMSLIQGLDVVYGMGHNEQQILGHFSNANPMPSIDWILAQSSKFYGGQVPIINTLSYGQSFSYGYSGTQFVRMPTFGDIGGSYERVFGFGNAATLSRQSGIMDRTFGLYKMLENNPRLPAHDRQLIQAQAALVSDLKNRLGSIKPLSCTIPAKPGNIAGNEEYFTNAIDMIVASFLCGATQVANVGIADPNPVSTPNGWHGDSHTSEQAVGAVPNALVVNKWIAEKFLLRLMQRLDGIVEANGKTMLDNSLILWGNEISGGNGHSSENMPVLLVGSAGGKIRSGYLYDFRQHNAPEVPIDNAGSTSKIGRPYNQLLVTILQAMGLSAADYGRGGIRGYGVNQTSNAQRNARYTSFMSEIGNPLPRLYLG